MNTLGKKLKAARESKNLGQKDVENLTGISYKTLSNYENNRSEPDVEKLSLLCKAYDTSADYFINTDYEQTHEYNFFLLLHEQEHIKKYRTISTKNPTGKEVIDYIVEKELARCTTPVPRPEIIEEEREPYNVLYISHPNNRASAGFGGDLNSDDVTMIKTIANRDTIRADFCVTVDGHSMEPLYRDGDLVLVHRQPAIEVGAIGVFVANDKGYIKKQGEDRLISVNDDYPDVEPEGCYEYKCFGEVIGVVDPEWIVE